MNTGKFVIMLTSLVVMALLVGAVFLPVVSSSTTRTVTTIEENEEPGWSRYAYTQTDDYSFGISIEDDTLNIGSQTLGIQTGELYDMMVLSTDVLTIVIDGDSIVAVSEDGAVDLGTSVNVTKTSSGLTVGDATYTAPLWSYYPIATGNYAYFDHADLLTDGKPLSAWGNFAGVYAYSQFTYPDVGLVMDATVTDGVIEGAIWGTAPDTLDIQPFNPGDVIFNPIDLDPIDVDLEPIDLGGGDNQIMGADPVGGTRIGDLYYSFTQTGYATIIGYASTINWQELTELPESVEYNGQTRIVNKIGTYAFQSCTNLILTSLPSGLTEIEGGGFYQCSGIQIDELPEHLTKFGYNAFWGCSGLTADIVIGSGYEIGSMAFADTGITNLVITGTPTINNTAFSTASLTDVLNLSTLEVTPTSFGFNVDEVRTNIDAVGFIAPLGITHHEQVAIESPTTDVINILPLVAGVGLLLVALGVFITRRI